MIRLVASSPVRASPDARPQDVLSHIPIVGMKRDEGGIVGLRSSPPRGAKNATDLVYSLKC